MSAALKPDAGGLQNRIARMLDNISRARMRPSVYPAYLASRVKRGLLAVKNDDSERIIGSVGDIETIGDCRYAISVTDHNGTEYEITVRVLDAALRSAGGE